MKKGFTLIELLAVIVILAIIALIATPIVLNIINDSRQSSNLRSADFYLDALEYSIADATMHSGGISNGTYSIMENGNLCIGALTNKVCSGDELEIEVNGEVPKKGTITITNGNISGANIILNEKEITKNSKGELVYVKTFDEVCKYISGTAKTAGAKYECKVDPNKDAYTFYVLTTPSSTDTSINLIMDRNINSDGTPVTKAISVENPENGVYNLLRWIRKEDYFEAGGEDKEWYCQNPDGGIEYSMECGNTSKGPITAMNFLKEATKNWTNVNEMLIDSFNDDEGKIYTMKEYNTYARMPYESEVTNSNGTNEYLYEYLDGGEWWGIEGKQPTNNISGISGYWIHHSISSNSLSAVQSMGQNYIDSVFNMGYNGVRPVINIKL